MVWKQKREHSGWMFFKKSPLTISFFLANVLLFFVGCDSTPLPPDQSFAENYLKEQTYNHCKRYQRMDAMVYGVGKENRYVFFSAPQDINYGGWKIKNSHSDVNYNCMFRRYKEVGQAYHRLLDFQVTPLEKTGSKRYTYTATMKIEFICMDKLYHDDFEYNAGVVWLYDLKKYDGFSRLDLQNQFAKLFKPSHDFLILTRRMMKDTAAEKKMVREIPLRYDAENLTWQWQNVSGKWLDGFASVTKLEEFTMLADAELLDTTDFSQFLSGDAAQNNKLLNFEYATYLCEIEYVMSLSRFLNDEFLFFCPGKTEPLWLDKAQYKASKELLALANKIVIEHQKVSPWQGLQALNKYYQAVAPVQDIIWKKVEKDLEKALDLICNTDFIEDAKKKQYLKKFIARLGECTNLKEHPRYQAIKVSCTAKLNKVNGNTGKD